MSKFTSSQQLTDWLALCDTIDEVAGGQTPCRSAPDVWFPRKTGDGYDQSVTNELRDAAQARELCRTSCEVIAQCRAYALKHEEMEGVWGGLNYRERRDIIRARRSTVTPTD